jgi:hypothetical protein
MARRRNEAELTVEPFAVVSAGDRAILEEEGARMLAFAAPEMEARAVRFTL